MIGLPRVVRGLLSRFARRLLKKVNYTSERLIGGRVFRIPVMATVGLGLGNGDHEPEVGEALRLVLASATGAFIDVGVNLGQTLLSFRAVSPHGRYIGFEANPRSAAYALELASRNAFPNTTILPVGLAEKGEVVELYLDSSDVSASASLQTQHKRPSFFKSSVTVLCERGDVMLDRLAIEKVGVIKIDVEGAELGVLRGMSRVIDRDQPAIMVEVLAPLQSAPGNVNRARLENAKAMDAWLSEHGYTAAALVKGSVPQAINSIAEQLLVAKGRNYLLTPRAG